MDRRTFLVRTALTPLVVSFDAKGGVLGPDHEDEGICRRKFELAVSLSLQRRPIGDVVVEMGKSFLGTEYLAHALEAEGEEKLVVNMRGLDCVSFYENALVLARCIKKNAMTFEDYKAELQFIRYRGGRIDGYPSRLHYTTDYIEDNEKKGVWKNITRELGGTWFEKTINFMSKHPESYWQLEENPDFLGLIRKQEEEITRREKFYIPKEMVEDIENKIMSGDILGITTDVEGLDTSHTGIAIRQKGALRFMHAPITGKKVEITDVTLVEYLERNRKQTGIIVARPLEPTTP